jgi:hypothetical protein
VSKYLLEVKRLDPGGGGGWGGRLIIFGERNGVRKQISLYRKNVNDENFTGDVFPDNFLSFL